MRIRRSAARLLGSAYSGSASSPAPDAAAALPFELPLPTPPPPPLPRSAAPGSLVGVGFPAPATPAVEPCVLSCSPWDLLAELTLSDSQVEDELLDKYFVHVDNRPSWCLTASMPASSERKGQLVAAAAGGDNNLPSQGQVAKKVLTKPVAKNALTKPVVSKEMEKKEREGTKKPKVIKEEAEEEKPQVWTCKKNDGKKWWCQRTVRQPNSLCDYHFAQKHPNCNPEMVSTAAVPASPVSTVATPKPAANSKPKPAANSKPRKKPAHNFGVNEGFYYYAGFGPFRSKRQCRTSMQHDSVPPKQEEEESPEDATRTNQADQGDDTSRPVAHGDVSSYDDITQIAGLDDSSDDDMLDAFGGDIKSNGESRANKYDDSTNKMNPSKKRRRKPVKARSLKSLM
ncbi:hypothetical protein ACP4OV_012495 [Aristida adscensionis]